MKATIQLLIIVCFAITQISNAQTSNEQNRSDLFLTIAPRFGAGIHNYTNFELGLSAIYIDTRGLEFGAISAYSTMIFQQSEWNSNFDTYGVKAGIQNSWAIFMMGLEWKTLFLKEANNNFLSPKIGFSILDAINLEYAYNILDSSNISPINSRHQIAINISFNRKIYRTIFGK